MQKKIPRLFFVKPFLLSDNVRGKSEGILQSNTEVKSKHVTS